MTTAFMVRLGHGVVFGVSPPTHHTALVCMALHSAVSAPTLLYMRTSRQDSLETTPCLAEMEMTTAFMVRLGHGVVVVVSTPTHCRTALVFVA